ncbi:MAG: tRNA pseudouridine(38-40) synthase TruA [Verrucomicrobiota bacterium]
MIVVYVKKSSAATYKLTLHYDGTPFKGWQRQGELPTVQLFLEKAIRKCWEKEHIIHGSGRTDTGVHAFGQVAHFKAEKKFDTKTLVRALNNNLPPEIRVLKAQENSEKFHARFSAKGKEYLYRVVNHEILPPFEINRAWHVPKKLDLKEIRKACRYLAGKHDFASFTSNPGYARHTTVRHLRSIKIKKVGSVIEFRFRGDGFLYRMVRNLMGALIKVGLSRLTPDDIQKILRQKSRQSAPNTAPAYGLYLVKVFY